VRILAETGPRASELCGVLLDHVDIYGDMIVIKQGKWARDRSRPVWQRHRPCHLRVAALPPGRN
jgi:integrase